MNTFFSLLAGRSVDPHFGQNCKTGSAIQALGGEFICWLGNVCFSRRIAIQRVSGLFVEARGGFLLPRLWRVFLEGSLEEGSFLPVIASVQPCIILSRQIVSFSLSLPC